jgi:tetratricopeptide (TPR) repeat protein
MLLPTVLGKDTGMEIRLDLNKFDIYYLMNENTCEYIDLLLLALDNLKVNNTAQAIEYFDKAIGVDPNDFSAYLSKAIVLNELKEPEEALKLIKFVIKLGPENCHTFMNKIKHREDRENIDNLCQYVHLNNYYSYTYVFKGRILSGLNLHNEAIKAFEKAIRVNPEYAKAYSNKGNSLAQLNMLEEAVICYKKSIELSQECKFSYYNLANTLKLLNRHEEALINYDIAISLSIDKEKLLFLNNKGLVLLELRRLNEALYCFDECLSIELNPMAYLNKALVLTDMQLYNEAIDCFKQSILIDNGNLLCYYYIGKILYTQDKYKEALEYLHKAFALNPDDEGIKSLITTIQQQHNIKKPTFSIITLSVILTSIAVCGAILFTYFRKK